MTVRSLLCATIFLSLGVPACQGDTLSVGGGDPLQPEDVSDTPPGDAKGEAVTGAYLFTGFDTRSCLCRSGSETLVCGDTELAGDGLWLIQDEGELEVRLFSEEVIGGELVLRGGVDADGAVRFGGVNTVTSDGQAIGQTTNQVEGSLEPRGRGELTWTSRAEYVLGSESFDCDIVLDLSIAWWDPAVIESCAFASDCHPGRPLCADDVCSTGDSGIGCTLGSECASGACQGGICAAADDCEAAGCPGEQICFQGSCQDGAEGDACGSPLDCVVGMRCTEGTCYDGSEGDPCGSGVDCAPAAQRCYLGLCQDGSQGDPCETNFQCDTLGGFSCGSSEVCE